MCRDACRSRSDLAKPRSCCVAQLLSQARVDGPRFVVGSDKALVQQRNAAQSARAHRMAAPFIISLFGRIQLRRNVTSAIDTFADEVKRWRTPGLFWCSVVATASRTRAVLPESRLSRR
jgi:hypothetical protein